MFKGTSFFNPITSVIKEIIEVQSSLVSFSQQWVWIVCVPW
jgi:hypothetical protein